MKRLLPLDVEAPLRVAVCGGGASAALLTHSLTKNAGRAIDLTIIDRHPLPGRGVAYATPCARHLLNVRADSMSADHEDAEHLQRWLEAHPAEDGHAWQPTEFLPRGVYGAYLQDLLRAAESDSVIHVSFVSGIARRARRTSDGWKVSLADGRTVAADVLVLATGNDVPAPVSARGAKAVQRFLIDNPWDAETIGAIPQDAPVMLLGTGLTAVDAVLSLLDNGHTGEIIAVSRNGLLPHVHTLPPRLPVWIERPYPTSFVSLFRLARRHVEPGGDERELQTKLDALRPILPELWGALSVQDKRRFLKHWRTAWNVHRHRMAPRIAAEMQAAIATGQLKIAKGRLQSLRANGRSGLVAHLLTEGKHREIRAARLINCTGPTEDLRRSPNPLLRDLLKRRLVRADELKLGLDVDEKSRAIGGDGKPHADVFALGALTKGRFWEVTAVPEIRAQAAAVARLIAALQA